MERDAIATRRPLPRARLEPHQGAKVRSEKVNISLRPALTTNDSSRSIEPSSEHPCGPSVFRLWHPGRVVAASTRRPRLLEAL